jgi:hypothetical protein
MRAQLSKIAAASLLICSSVFTLTFPLSNQANATTSYSFTNAGASGMNGPTQGQVNSAYSATTLAGKVLINTQGIQEWAPTSSGLYQINLAGASGGGGISGAGGKGAFLSIKVSLTAGETLSIVVGQKGSDSNTIAAFPSGAGGGGTFVYKKSDNSYIAVAGGGGGGGGSNTNLLTSQSTANGKFDTTTGSSVTITGGFNSPGGTSGSGGRGSTRLLLFGGPGAGVNSDGATSNNGQGKSRLNGWIGGNASTCTYPAAGGFGGGGGAGCESASYNLYGWAGGGGGYSGGGAGGNGGNSDGQYGGGGGSYYTGTFLSGTTGSNIGHGYVTITSSELISTTNTVSITGSPATAEYNRPLTVSAAVSQPGKITFTENGRKIPGCIAKIVLTSTSCIWKPRIRGSVRVVAILTPADAGYSASTSAPVNISVIRRITPR